MVGGLLVCGGFMSNTIAVEELRVGMFIHLDGGWLSHPFPLSSFRIASPEQIQTLRGLGLAQVRWSPEKSELPPSAEEIAAAQAAAQQQASSSHAEERPTSSAASSSTRSAKRPSAASASTPKPPRPGAMPPTRLARSHARPAAPPRR
jgi:hypothetical protein